MSEERGVGSNLLMNDTSHDTIVEAVEANSFSSSCSTVQLMVRSWESVKTVIGYAGFSKFSPLWDNKNLKELKVMGKIEVWDRRGIHCLAQLYRAGRFKSFQEIVEEYAVPNRLFYSYLQVRHALDAQFRGKEPEWREMSLLRKLVNTSISKGLISDMYGCISMAGQEGEVESKKRIKWERDVGPVMEVQWNYVLALGPRVSLSFTECIPFLIDI